MRTLLIDADSVIYAAASAHETSVQWDADTWTTHGDFDAARAKVDSDILKLQERLGADLAVLALSDYTDPWRKKILPSYKANRKDTRKPVLLKPLRAYLHERYDVFQRPGLEGDDVLGILLTAPKPPAPVAGERILCSVDKDMSTLPGLHFNWKKDTGAKKPNIREVTVVEADRCHMTQTLTGDAVDGYKGCPGVGPKKAERLLSGLTMVDEMWPVVLGAFEGQGLTEDDALVQARVARICRASDFDFKKKEVRLWDPRK